MLAADKDGNLNTMNLFSTYFYDRRNKRKAGE
jgi:hypothetical protein